MGLLLNFRDVRFLAFAPRSLFLIFFFNYGVRAAKDNIVYCLTEPLSDLFEFDFMALILDGIVKQRADGNILDVMELMIGIRF